MSIDDILRYQLAIDCSLEELVAEVRAVIGSTVTDYEIVSRVKDPETLEKKMRLKGTSNVIDIDDVYALRILVGSFREVYLVMEKVYHSFNGQMLHDHIQTPKTRPDKPALAGKQLRLLKFVGRRNNVLFEVQVTTRAFNEQNELLHPQYHMEKYG